MALPSLTRDPWGPYTDLAHIKAVEDALGTGWLSNPGMPKGVEDPFAKLVENQNTAITQEYNQQRIDAEKKRLADEAMAQAELQAAEGTDLDTLGGIAKKLGDVQLMMNVEKEKSSRANVEADNKRAEEQKYINAMASLGNMALYNPEMANQIMAEQFGYKGTSFKGRPQGGSGGSWVGNGQGVDPETGELVFLQRNSKTGEIRKGETNYEPKETVNPMVEAAKQIFGFNGNPTNTTTDNLRQIEPKTPQGVTNIPIGTTRQKADGIYQRTAQGWKKIKENN